MMIRVIPDGMHGMIIVMWRMTFTTKVVVFVYHLKSKTVVIAAALLPSGLFD